MPAGCRAHATELARWQWRLADAGDPAELVTKFLSEYGLATALGSTHEPPHDRTPICGAGLFISAAAGVEMVAARRPSLVGSPSPTSALPDVVAVVYADRASSPAGHGGTDWFSAPTGVDVGEWVASWTPEVHAAAVEAVRTAIARGDVYQVNLVGHASASISGAFDPRRVSALPGARYAGGLSGDGWAITCASPETLVEVVDGMIYTRPIKGTRPATDAGLAELMASTKERAEHIMIVDLERNDLAHVAATGSVCVTDLYAVRRWCDLWQAESEVAARLADGVGLADILRAVCPGGSVTGAPKLAALELIARLEPVGRGASMGALGWVGRDRLDLGLTIRTVAVADGRAHLWAGGGITWDSDPWAEVAEAAAKAAPLRRALAAPPMAEGIR